MSGHSFTVLRRPSFLDNSTLEFYHSYWLSKRRGRRLPSRSDIVPAEIRGYLPSILLADVLPGAWDFRYRLVGSRVADYFLGDATGVTLREACARAGLDSDLVEEAADVLRTVCEEKEPLLVLAGHGEWFGHIYPAHEVLHLPLSDDDNNVNMILMAFAFEKLSVPATRRRETGIMPAAPPA